MGKSFQFLVTGLATLLAFAFGFLLGDGASDPAPKQTIQPSLQAEDLREILRQELRGLSLAEDNPAHSVGSGSADHAPIASSPVSGRTPSWDGLIQRINAAAERLERAAALAEKGAKPTVADQVALARAGTHPQNVYAVKDYCHRLDDAEEKEWEKINSEVMFLAPNQVLARFGEPTEISLDVGSMYWEYYLVKEISSDDEYYWQLGIAFTGGAVMEIDVDHYDGD